MGKVGGYNPPWFEMGYHIFQNLAPLPSSDGPGHVRPKGNEDNDDKF